MKKSYCKLDVLEYTNIIKDTLIPLFDDYDGEFITMLDKNTVFTIKPHYYNNLLMGWNVYGNGILLETKSTIKKAKRYLNKIVAK